MFYEIFSCVLYSQYVSADAANPHVGAAGRVARSVRDTRHKSNNATQLDCNAHPLSSAHRIKCGNFGYERRHQQLRLIWPEYLARKHDKDKGHGECFQTIYRYLREGLVNPMIESKKKGIAA